MAAPPQPIYISVLASAFARNGFPARIAAWSCKTNILQSRGEGGYPTWLTTGLGTTTGVVAALAFAAGTTRARLAVTAANAARGFRRDMSGGGSSVPDGRGAARRSLNAGCGHRAPFGDGSMIQSLRPQLAVPGDCVLCPEAGDVRWKTALFR
jgi:hypothetical protein